MYSIMNMLSFADLKERIAHRLRFRVRIFDPRRRIDVFSKGEERDAIRRIYVINLDRKPDRWKTLRSELDRFYERNGEPLSAIVRRFSAIDARYLETTPSASMLRPTFTLADQLAVHPNPVLQIDDVTRAREITMTPQEVAIALSHIEVWKLIADGDVPGALVLEDDVFMPYGFAQNLERTWSTLTTHGGESDFDLLYLAYREVGTLIPTPNSLPQRRYQPGIWEASGYVITRQGARKLLDQLPAYGPIDLWLNLQFGNLRVFTAARRLIEQRIDEPSTNSYSILPVLSQVGAVTREKPLVTAARQLAEPVIVVGPQGSGLTALAKALSMLGYTCLSDLDVLPSDEFTKLRAGRKNRTFNAYVNIGNLGMDTLSGLASANPRARFIVTKHDERTSKVPTEQLLQLNPDLKDKWAVLTEYLGLDYPSFPYPKDSDLGQRSTETALLTANARPATNLKFDESPWILRNTHRGWCGISTLSSTTRETANIVTSWTEHDTLDDKTWKLRDDTFPSNLALFTPANFSHSPDESATLTLRAEETSVRQFTSAAIASHEKYLYGSFSADLQPSNVSGVITGLFLHRNGPRQEIDIEFLGKDTTKMLVNVYYNPGPDGTKLEYGYRGTPTLIDLGFDAATSFHNYEIEWWPNGIRWKVDGHIVHERSLWNPTPIPDRPMEFNLNLWHSRSKEFAGNLDKSRIPAVTKIRSIQMVSQGHTTAPNDMTEALADA